MLPFPTPLQCWGLLLGLFPTPFVVGGTEALPLLKAAIKEPQFPGWLQTFPAQERHQEPTAPSGGSSDLPRASPCQAAEEQGTPGTSFS